MAQPFVKSTIYLLVFGVWKLSPQVLSHEDHACFEKIERDRQGPRRRVSGRHHWRIISEGHSTAGARVIRRQRRPQATPGWQPQQGSSSPAGARATSHRHPWRGATLSTCDVFQSSTTSRGSAPRSSTWTVPVAGLKRASSIAAGPRAGRSSPSGVGAGVRQDEARDRGDEHHDPGGGPEPDVQPADQGCCTNTQSFVTVTLDPSSTDWHT